MSALTMVEVIVEHERVQGIRDMAIHCKCGWAEKTMLIRNSRKAFAAHQSDMLTAAGFGSVETAKKSARRTSCPTRLMDNRNEISCWLEAGHEGDCK